MKHMYLYAFSENYQINFMLLIKFSKVSRKFQLRTGNSASTKIFTKTLNICLCNFHFLALTSLSYSSTYNQYLIAGIALRLVADFLNFYEPCDGFIFYRMRKIKVCFFKGLGLGLCPMCKCSSSLYVCNHMANTNIT